MNQSFNRISPLIHSFAIVSFNGVPPAPTGETGLCELNAFLLSKATPLQVKPRQHRDAFALIGIGAAIDHSKMRLFGAGVLLPFA